MAGYLFPLETEVPTRLDCAVTADAVYERMQWPDAVNDLSLPDPVQYPWGPITPMVHVVFKYEYTENLWSIPVSSTRVDNESKHIICTIHCSYKEVQQCTDLIQSRFVHHITDAIRTAVVRTTVKLHNIPVNTYTENIPPKHPKERVFKSRFLFGMGSTDNSFHPGHWMEHNLFGGIIAGLTGSFFTNKADPEGSKFEAKSPDTLAYIKIVARSGFYVWAFKRDHYKYIGYVYNVETRTFGTKEEIFNSPSIICPRDR